MKLPVWEGLPDKVPEEKLMPVGSEPLSENVVVPTPPVCVKVTGVKAVPAVPADIDAGLTVIVGQLITRV